MRSPSSPIAVLVALFALCVAAGCARENAAGTADGTSAKVAPNLLRLAATCHERGGDWIRDKGCGMTEKLCFAMFHGHATWFKGPGCMVNKSGTTDNCSHEGMQGGTQYSCYIHYIPVADWRNTK